MPAEAETKQQRGDSAPTVSMPQVSLPKGGGAIKGIGEKFSVNAANGTASLTVPIAASPGRSGFGPQLSLSYDSGGGNGPFGFGWSLGLPSITRKTDKGLPRYDDKNESDEFILSGAEDLVPVPRADGQLSRPRKLHGMQYDVHLYRPRIEGLFSRIERWTERESGISHWRTISRDNVATLYGFTPDSRIVDPANARRIFSYLICRTWDDRGNVAVYEYKAEDGARIVTTSAHESNRRTPQRVANRYLKFIRYGGATPWFPNWAEIGEQTPLPASWHFELVFDYGDHRALAPVPIADGVWPVRPDPFSSYRAGFEVRTYRRCERALMFHHFDGEPGVGSNCLVRSTDFTYSDEVAPTDPRNPVYTFLQAITQRGYRREGAGYVTASMPPLEFEYTEPRVRTDVETLDRPGAASLPNGVEGTQWQWVDLEGEGLSGVLGDFDGGWGYMRNVSPLTRTIQPDGSQVTTARLGSVSMVAEVPAGRYTLREIQFLDLAGDGRVDAVSFERPVPGFFERTTDERWESFRAFRSLPDIDWSDANLRFVDLTGDGHADVLLTEDDVFTTYPSLGEDGFDRATVARQPWDEADGPRLVLSDGTQTVFLADMSGDGLSDIVRVRNGDVCYWPNLGYGRFSRKVAMDAAPRFVDEERFDPRRVRFADIDGSGTTDLLYVGESGVVVCFNRSGNSWAEPQRLAVFPSADAISNVQVTDLLGTGTSCLVWSSALPGFTGRSLRYVNLMVEKPHLLQRLRNNLGAETRLSYVPSTFFYCKDREAGRPWITRLPFPVQLLERVEAYDWIGRSRFVTRYDYHHGFFDGDDREFRGFGMVEQWDTEEHSGHTAFPPAANWDEASWSPPVRTCTWFHTGAFSEAGVVSRQYAHEYWTEPALRDVAHTAEREAMLLPDTVLPSGLTARETKEAYRALKGSVLRREIYAEDGSASASNPYTITEQNFTIVCKQGIGANRHAVFHTHPREKVTFDYERQGSDPRVNHDVTLAVNAFGDITRSVNVAYPRRPGTNPEPLLSSAFRQMLAHDQERKHIVATENGYTIDFTDAVTFPDLHRAAQPCEAITAELTSPPPARQLNGITNLFTFEELRDLWAAAWTGTSDVLYEDVPVSDVDGVGGLPSSVSRRIVEHTKTRYRSNDLTVLLGFGALEGLALPGESYRRALTQSHLTRVFGARVTPAILAEGGYVQLDSGGDWWIPSGRLFYSPGDSDTPAAELTEARAHFFVTRRAVDAFGAITRTDIAPYDLLAASNSDAVGNVTVAENDYRVLHARVVIDPNGNRVETAFDALGFVVAQAFRGKTTETLGDSLLGLDTDPASATVLAYLANPFGSAAAMLGRASIRLVYDLFAYQRTRNAPQPLPAVVATLTRTVHDAATTPANPTEYNHAFAYSDGLGREIQTKIQAEPGNVPGVAQPVARRWVGSGWTIYNNKGKPVRKYEPFFSATNGFEFGVISGVSDVHFYDPVGRQIALLRPDDTWEKTVIDAWRERVWDVNDTVLEVDPRLDIHVGDHFRRALGASPGAFTSWYSRRMSGMVGATPADVAAEQDAATKASQHTETPSTTHFDSLGRSCFTVAHNAGNTRHANRMALDVEGKPLAVIDALGHRVVENCLREVTQTGQRYVSGYDIAGNALYVISAEGGARRTLLDAAGNHLRAWDDLNRTFRTRYDAARRPTHRIVKDGAAQEVVYERLVYGEGQANRNLCGRLFRHYDTTGLAANDRYDFKGNLTESSRHLAAGYHDFPNWAVLGDVTDTATLDTLGQLLLASTERFVTHTTFDALNRPIQLVTAAKIGSAPSVVRQSYNEADLVDSVDVWVRLAAPPAALLDPATADIHAVTDIQYNARGQRTMIAMGNGTVTRMDYDAATFRVAHVVTTRPAVAYPGDCPNPAPVGWPGCQVQNLSYAYDPIGNVTRIRDDAQQKVFFQNQRVEPSVDYTYDATYRLTRADGREHVGQQGGSRMAPTQPGNDDGAHCGLAQPSDGAAMVRYTETYAYDQTSNLLDVLHQASSGTWRRRYAYNEASRIDAAVASNRLSATSHPGDPVSGPYSATHSYDAHGNTVALPHLPEMRWDALDRLQSTTTQVVNNATPEKTFYAYDSANGRVRKVFDSAAPANQAGVRRRERIYLGLVEVYREYDLTGQTVTLERETLLVPAVNDRILIVETRTVDDGVDPAPAQMKRFQYTNHLESAVLELDESADVVSYEEFFPYGSTSYQAVRSRTETPKRYRYSGKERDEENGLYYFGARYFAPWIGRWVSCDPLGLKDGPNVYAGISCNPTSNVDVAGTETGAGWWDDTIEGIHEAKKWVKETSFKAGEIVQDNAERDMDRMGIKEGSLLRSILRTKATIEATIVATTLEVAADVVMIGPNILAGLDSAGTNIGEGLARTVEAKNSEEALLGIAQTAGGVGEGALVAVNVLTLGEGAQIRPGAATRPGMTQTEVRAAVREQFTRFEGQVTADSTSVLTRTAEQVHIDPFTSARIPGQPLPATGPRVIVDTVQQSRLSGAPKLVDAKSSATAGFTRNQTVGYPQIAQFGGIVRGTGGGTVLPAGTVIPPTTVQVVRPAGLIAKKALQATTANVTEAQVNKKKQ